MAGGNAIEIQERSRGHGGPRQSRSLRAVRDLVSPRRGGCVNITTTSQSKRDPIMATVTTPLTTAELLALPENGMDRWLIAGELRERPMSTRNRIHSRIMTCTATELENWRRLQPEPRGEILTGDAGV